MRKPIIITVILLVATAAITVLYFKNLNPPGSNTDRVMAAIPDDASVIFQFSNEKSFYDIFSGNTLLNSAIGNDKLADIDTLRSALLGNAILQKYFDGQSVFVSLHTTEKGGPDLLLTTSAIKGFDPATVEQLAAQKNTGLIFNAFPEKGVKGYEIYISTLKKRFYLVDKGEHIFSGSFSEALAYKSAQYQSKTNKKVFITLSEQQNSNSLANLYVNYGQLNALFDALFQNKYSDIFKSLRMLPAQAALSLNYKNDAFMFGGITDLHTKAAISYLNIFATQQPVVNHLKDIFPATTAYSTNFSVSDPAKFGADLAHWHMETGLKAQKDAVFEKVRAETGIKLLSEFNNVLGNEFAIVTTRYQEKYAIIAVKDGSKLFPLMMNISHMVTDKIGQFNYEKLPFFLLGDPFGVLKRPYFMIVDSYLVLASTQSELTSYYDTYFNRKFLSRMDQYNQFDDLLSERSNVAFFVNFKNMQPILKRDLTPAFYNAFEKNGPGWKDFYAASYELSASDKNFYTNFCMRLNNVDSTAVNTPLE